ncbi:MAG: hypothetical protein WDZ94_03010 [Patescibacteria group bacterium]
MKTEVIKAAFTNILFVIGVILLIFGFISGTQTASKILLFEQYPLNSYEETRCEMNGAYPSTPRGDTTISAEDVEAQRERCYRSLEQERTLKQVSDIVTATTTLIAGFVLVLSFKRFIFKS